MATFIESEINSDYYNNLDETDKKKTFLSSFYKLWDEKIIILVILMLLVVALPYLLYLAVFDSGNFSKDNPKQCLVDNIYRVSCGKENITNTDCTKIFCCFEPRTNSCYHSEPSMYYYYQEDSENYVPIQKKTPLGLASLGNLKMDIVEESETLRIILNSDLGKNPKINSANFDIVENENNKLSVSVYRKNTTEILFTTLKGPLIASEEYLEWTIQLTNTSGVFFGLGELKIDLDENSTLTKIIYKNQIDHNTLPIFMAYNNGKYHAAKIIHEGALQVTVLPSYLVLLRCLYGRKIEIEIIDGPTPMDVYNKLRSEDKQSNLVPEWALGLHICREEPAESLNDLLEQYSSFVTKRDNYPDFSYESDCIHDDLLLHLMKENSPNNTKLVDTIINSMKEKFLLSYPPQIPVNSEIFDKYNTSSIFYTDDTTGEFYVGKYKGFDVVFPNYKHKGIRDFLSDVEELFERIEINGITFTNSWPQDDSYEMTNSTYFNNEAIQKVFSKTLPWNLQEDGDLHLRDHNDYGPTVRERVNEQFIKQDFSLSSVSNITSYEPLIVQNVNTSWSEMKHYLRTSLYNSLFGHNLISVPICGSNDGYDQQFNEDLCLRWYILAATMPLTRVSSKGSPRDPISLNSQYSIKKVIDVLEKRRSLVPYYRTILNYGGPIIRPMFFNFPQDENVHSLDEQYMVGDAILVAQPMSPDVEQLKIYLPPSKVWYEFWGGMKYTTKKGEEWIKFPIFKSDWVSFIAEGNIVPLVTTSKTDNDIQISLITAMNKTCQAEGSLLLHFSDEELDVSVKFSASEKNITLDTTEEKHDVIKELITTVCFYSYTENNGCESADQYNIV